MRESATIILIAGSSLIAFVSSFLYWAPVMTPWFPMPFYLVLFAWFTLYGSPLLLPSLYFPLGMSLEKAKRPGMWVFTITLGVLVLDLAYLLSAWKHGFRYQGEFHTRLVLAENLIAGSALLALSCLGFRKTSLNYHHAVLLLLFLFLAWCAFPYLGETP